MRRTINRTIIFSLFLIILSAGPGWGATYYVKTGGNDSLNGLSDANAWATIAKVQATVTSGDTVYFRSQDTWSSASLPVLGATAGVTYDGSTYGIGTRAKIRATGGSAGNVGVVNIYVGNVTFKGFEVDGNQQWSGGIYIGMYAVASISNITVDNCVVHDIGSATDDWLYGIHIGTINGNMTVSNVAVTNTTIYNTNHEGIAIYPSWLHAGNIVDTVLIRNCTIYNAGAHISIKGVGLSVVNNADNVTIEYCQLYNNGNTGIQLRTSLEASVGAANNLIVRYNIIHDNSIWGISVSNPQQLTMTGDFYGNLIYGNGKVWDGGTAAYDIEINGTEYSSTVLNFYNNTIYTTTNPNTTRYAMRVDSLTGRPVINFKNNIVYTGDYVAIWDMGGILTHSNNLIYRTSGANDTHVLSNGTSYKRAGVKTWEATAQNTDPTFTGGTLPTGFSGTYGTNMVPNTSYFAITSGNAIDKGATIGNPYNGCINGAGLATPITRPQGAAYDIGAYEYAESAPVRLSPPANFRPLLK